MGVMPWRCKWCWCGFLRDPPFGRHMMPSGGREAGERSGGKKVMATGTTVQLNRSQTYCMATLSLGQVPKCKLGHGASDPQLGQGLKCEFGSIFVWSFSLWAYLGNVTLDSFHLSLDNSETPSCTYSTT